jgi:hypothetical protein
MKGNMKGMGLEECIIKARYTVSKTSLMARHHQVVT